MKVFVYGLVSLCMLASPVFGQQKTKEKQNPLVSGKLMYVGHMPERIDRWIVNDLKEWGKYKPTRDSEGVDLVMKAYAPERRTEYRMRNGLPQPRRVPQNREQKDVMFTIDVSDWVTGHLVWQADVLNRKPKNDHPATPGEEMKIRARGLSSEQLAQTVVNALRSYVDHLAAHPAAH